MAGNRHRSSRNRQPGRGRPARRGSSHLAPVPGHGSHPAEDAQAAELFQQIRQALRSKEPLDLLMTVSGLLSVTDTRQVKLPGEDEPRIALPVLVDSFIWADYAETTAVLTIMEVLVDDAALRERIQQALAGRRQPMPPWLKALAQSQIDPVVSMMSDVLGDGVNYLLGLALAGGHYLTAVIYVDTNLGGVLKDAFMIPAPPEEVNQHFRNVGLQQGQVIADTDPAQARAVIEAAIEHGHMMLPPLESDTWPHCRPLIEWMVRQLPAGGVAPEAREWTERQREDITSEFMASPFAAHLDDPDHEDLMDPILWYATGWSGGDPFRWSPVRVELLMRDWFPRKVMADAEYLSKLPIVLRAYIRFCQDRLSIPSSRIRETLDAVDEWEPEYQRTIRSERLQGAHALLASMLPGFVDELADLEDESYDDEPFDDRDLAAYMLASLERCVGSRITLMNLDDAPLPDEAFSWAGIPQDIQPSVREVLDHCDRVADQMMDIEMRTSMRRLLGRIAVGDPAIFRRKASLVRGAAAVAWLAYRANHVHRVMTTQDLLAAFGVSGSVSQRAEPMLRAIGVDPHARYGAGYLAAADLLTSARRASIIVQRDRYLAMAAE